ncbi:relaxase domain-containing protein [Streptomyces rubiginosohelvolus]|uniref:relaxase domain-containing protein n=1 Tax=Streptomyces rubiginosohelvolus TaxID=67362 RepID=UPI003662A8EB
MGAASRPAGTGEESPAAAPAWRAVLLIGLSLRVRGVRRGLHDSGYQGDPGWSDVPLPPARDRRRRRPARTPLRAAQEQAGVPDGRWMGRGLAVLGLAPGEEVSEAQLRNLFGERGRHPDAKGVPRRRVRHRPCCPLPRARGAARTSPVGRRRRHGRSAPGANPDSRSPGPQASGRPTGVDG